LNRISYKEILEITSFIETNPQKVKQLSKTERVALNNALKDFILNASASLQGKDITFESIKFHLTHDNGKPKNRSKIIVRIYKGFCNLFFFRVSSKKLIKNARDAKANAQIYGLARDTVFQAKGNVQSHGEKLKEYFQPNPEMLQNLSIDLNHYSNQISKIEKILNAEKDVTKSLIETKTVETLKNLRQINTTLPTLSSYTEKSYEKLLLVTRIHEQIGCDTFTSTVLKDIVDMKRQKEVQKLKGDAKLIYHEVVKSLYHGVQGNPESIQTKQALDSCKEILKGYGSVIKNITARTNLDIKNTNQFVPTNPAEAKILYSFLRKVCSVQEDPFFVKRLDEAYAVFCIDLCKVFRVPYKVSNRFIEKNAKNAMERIDTDNLGQLLFTLVG
jgi:hypothetical protein